MRYLKIMALHFEHVAEHRARSFVWLLVSLFNPLLFILFWQGAFQGRSQIAPGWTLSAIISYYFILTIASAMLMSHIEDSVARVDIQEGNLTPYLMKPFSYFWLKFFEEVHYRLLQGSYAIIVFGIFYYFLGKFIIITSDIRIIALSIIAFFLAYLLSFSFKMIFGMAAFWTTDIAGLNSLKDVVLVIFAGYILPIALLPTAAAGIAYVLPFAYMIYFPVMIIQGKLPIGQVVTIIIIQVMWLLMLAAIYRLIWRKGISQFTGIGQ